MENNEFLNDETAIHGLLHTMKEAFNAGDVDRVVGLHTENVVLMESNIPALSGKQALRELFTTYFEKRKEQSIKAEIDFEVLETEVICDRAFTRGKVTVATEKNGSSSLMTGKFLCLFQKQENGSWLRSHIVSNSDAPGEPHEMN